MLTRPIILVVFFLFIGIGASAQPAASDSLKQKPAAAAATAIRTPAPMKEETVEGFWALTTYLGSKLASEVGNRMNLDESSGERKLVRVKIQVGPFKVERIETR